MSDAKRKVRRKDELLFVYGTLRRGAPNHEFFLTGAEFLGEARTASRYTLMTSLEKMLPYLLDIPTVCVVGEVYRVKSNCLRAITRLEELAGYSQRRIDVSLIETGSVVSSFGYFWDWGSGGLTEVLSGDWGDVITAVGR